MPLASRKFALDAKNSAFNVCFGVSFRKKTLVSVSGAPLSTSTGFGVNPIATNASVPQPIAVRNGPSRVESSAVGGCSSPKNAIKKSIANQFQRSKTKTAPAAATKRGLSGLEFAFGIPGTIGGAVYMNAGAYGSQISTVLTASEYLQGDRILTRNAEDHQFGYRTSIYRSTDDVILSAEFTLTPGDPSEIAAKMTVGKQVTDVHSNIFFQMLVNRFLEEYDLDEHIAKIRVLYKEKCEAMISCLEKNLPEGCTITHPQGGLFIWCKLPETIDANVFSKELIKDKVAVVPGSAFLTDEKTRTSCIRLNYSMPTIEQIEKGTEILGRCIREKM